MISDVLATALAEIERYQADPAFAQAYADPAIQERLDALLEQMQALLALLDTPPEVTRNAKGGR